MPTAAKLVGAVFFAVLGYFMAEAYKPLLPASTPFGQFSPICAVIGLACGWFVAGPNVGRGYWRAWGLGVRTAITTVFWATVAFSIYEMVIRSMRMRYDGPMEALTAAVELVGEYGANMLDQRFILTVLIGGAIGGLIVEAAGRRWS